MTDHASRWAYQSAYTPFMKWMVLFLLLLPTAPPAHAGPSFDPPAYDLARLHQTASLKDFMACLLEPQRRHTWLTALQSERWRPLTQVRLGYLDYPVWTRVRIVNSAPVPKTVVLYNQRPMVNFLTVRVLDGDAVAKQEHLGFMAPPSSGEVISDRLSSISLSIPAGGVRTILTRLETRGVMEAGWDVASVAFFSRKSRMEFVSLGLYAGVMFSLILHGLAAWFFFREVQFGFFVGYAFSFLFLMLSINGFTRIVSLGLPPGFWFTGTFVSVLSANVFWILFTQHFLNTASAMPRMHRWLTVLGALFVLSALSYIGTPWFPRLYLLTSLWTGFGLVLYVTVLAAGVSAVVRKLPHARLYLVGHALAFAASGLLVAAGQTSLIERFSTTLMVIPWIVALHVLVMGVSLGMITRQARFELGVERARAMDQSRFTVIGRTIGMVVHQWRTPLARLGAQIMELTAYFRSPEALRNHEELIRNDLLPAMGRGMRSLAETVETFSDFFSSKRPSEDFDPGKVTDHVLEMLGGRLARLGVEIVRSEAPGPLPFHGRPAALAHVLMILLGNALDVLEARRVSRPRVTLGLETGESGLTLTVTDNGGGIDLDPVERVFDTFVSEKGKGHMGLGLGLARRVAEEGMGGTIRVENVAGGARFTVRLPRQVTHGK